MKTEIKDDWTAIIPKIGKKGAVITISGGQGGGKTGLGYYLLSLAEKYDMDAYSYGIPKEKTHLLPDYIERIRCEPQNMPVDSFILIDEAWLDFYAQESGTSKSREMGKIINLARQRHQVLIFVSHVLAKLEINVVREVNTLVFKKPSLLHKEFERREIKKLTDEAYEELKQFDDYQKYSYVYSEDYRGLMTNPLPDFWSDELSCIYAGKIDIYQGTSYADLLSDRNYRELIKRIIHYEENDYEEIGVGGWEWHDVRASPSRLNKLVREGILDITYKSNNATHYKMLDEKREELKDVLPDS